MEAPGARRLSSVAAGLGLSAPTPGVSGASPAAGAGLDLIGVSGIASPAGAAAEAEAGLLRLGFVGVGTINSAVCRGLCTSDGPEIRALVGPRNAAKAAALVDEFPGQVEQAPSNQAVLDGSTIILLGTPGGADSLRQVCSELSFRPEHRVISLVAGASHSLLRELTLPAASATIALPLPPAEWHASTTKIFPRDEVAEALMGRVGSVIAFDSFEKMATLSIGSLMGHFYKQLETVEAWLVAQGIPPQQAAEAVAAYFTTFHSASSRQPAPGLFTELVEEQTPGGMNEQVIREVGEAGGYAAIESALDGVLARALGKR